MHMFLNQTRCRPRRLVLSVGLIVLVLFFIRRLVNGIGKMEPYKRLEFMIRSSWDSVPVDHRGISLVMYGRENGLAVEVDAPFFNDPPNPGGKPGLPYQGLWDYEVVEVFFLNQKNRYLEVEMSPHGQHLVLLLSDYRKPFKDLLNLTYTATINGNSWNGKAIIPWDYFPPDVEKFNAYAIHGSGKERVYESLYPVPSGKFKEPDFHRLDYFHALDLGDVLPASVKLNYPSSLWQNLKEPST